MAAVWWITLGVVVGVAIGLFIMGFIIKSKEPDLGDGDGSLVFALLGVVIACLIVFGGAENIVKTPVLSKEMPVVDTLVTTVNGVSDTTYRFNFYPKCE